MVSQKRSSADGFTVLFKTGLSCFISKLSSIGNINLFESNTKITL